MMRTEHTRQTRWGHDPETVDPDQVLPGSTYVREMVWVPCPECDLQVHAAYARLLTAGVRCPECGRQVAAPLNSESPQAAQRVLAREDQFRRNL
jgi:endogenous inhibitor of DNA gyrase (YacG/DUF329 family)